MSRLEQLHHRIRRCRECPLHGSRRHAVPGEGSPKAKVMFVGEAPGAAEDKQGRPFVGRAGAFLNELLDRIGVQREKVFITSSVKCRPPDNRTPHKAELSTCDHLWLRQQIAVIDPQLIVLLGKTPTTQLLGESKPIQELHGKIRKVNERACLITYHPAAGMRFPAARQSMIRDFDVLRREVEP